MKTIIHVNQHVVRRNAKTGEREPPLTVRTYKGTRRANVVRVNGPCEVVYSPDDPLSCGARAWIVTEAHVEVE